MNLRSFHRMLGLWLFIFIINVAATGLLRANAKWWYWKDSPSSIQPIPLVAPKVTINEALEIYHRRFPEGEIQLVQFKSVLDEMVYQVESKKGEKKRLLVSASSGKIISPVDESWAIKTAQGYVDKNNQVISVQNLSSFKARKNQEPRPAFMVRFDDQRKTEVFVDQETGEVLSVLNNGKRFGLWVSKLHELDFLGMSRVALTILGLAIIFLSVAGLFLRWSTQHVIKGRSS